MIVGQKNIKALRAIARPYFVWLPTVDGYSTQCIMHIFSAHLAAYRYLAKNACTSCQKYFASSPFMIQWLASWNTSSRPGTCWRCT